MSSSSWLLIFFILLPVIFIWIGLKAIERTSVRRIISTGILGLHNRYSSEERSVALIRTVIEIFDFHCKQINHSCHESVTIVK